MLVSYSDLWEVYGDALEEVTDWLAFEADVETNPWAD